jgi:two-component system response regulator
MTKPVILLVDDDDDFLEIAERAIRREEVRALVQVVRNGDEALQFLGLARPEEAVGPPANLVAVFLDLDMPRVTGWDVLDRVRSDARTRELPVVVVSSSARREDVRRSYDLGANSYVVKHFDPAGPGRYLARAIRYWSELNRVPGWAPGANHEAGGMA